MATSKALSLGLAGLALAAAAGVGFFVLGPEGEPPPERDGPAVVPPEREAADRVPPDRSRRPPEAGRVRPPENGGGLDRDPEGISGGATAEDILAAFEKADHDPNAWKEIERLLSINGSDDPRVTEKILQYLAHERFRNWAAELARHLKDPHALEKFLALARDPKAHPWTRAVALLAGANVGGAEVGAVAADILRAEKPGSNLFGAAARALAQSGTTESALVLLELLRNTAHGGSQAQLVEALGMVDNPRVLAELGRIALEDGDPALRASVIEALGRTRDPAVVDDLLRVVREEEDPELRMKAYAALGMVGDARATDALIGALQGGDDSAKLEAARALSGVKSPASAPGIEKALESSVDERLLPYLVQALGNIGSKSSVKPLTRILEDDLRSEGIRIQAARSLGQIGDPAAAGDVLETLENTPKSAAAFRAALVQALHTMASKEHIPTLEHLRNSVDMSSSEWYLLDQLIKKLSAPK